MPKPGYSSITMRESDYNYWMKEWEKLKDQYRREKGITSFSGYICYLLSLAGELDKARSSLRFEHFNTYEDHATIRDHKLGLYVDVYPKPEGKLWCSYCESFNCEHTGFALTIPEIIGPLKKRGWEPKGG